MAEEVLARIGKCIYCHTIDGPLQKEHIVPYGLDGRWILEQASCTKCADITSALERYVLRTHLIRPRSALKMRTRRKHERPETFSVVFERGGREETQELAIQKQPVFLLMPLFDWPGCTIGKTYSRGIKLVGGDLIQVAGVPVSQFKKTLVERGIAKAKFKGRFRAQTFARLVAKIAYGFAVVKVGLENIEEGYVLSAILRRSNDIGRWVGCDLEQPPSKEDAIHRITVRITKKGEIIGHVKLFAQFGTQEYLVAVGQQKGKV